MPKVMVKFFLVISLIVVLVLILASACFIPTIKLKTSDQGDLARSLEKQGYTNIKITGANFSTVASNKQEGSCMGTKEVVVGATNHAGKNVNIHVYSWPLHDVVEKIEK